MRELLNNQVHTPVHRFVQPASYPSAAQAQQKTADLNDFPLEIRHDIQKNAFPLTSSCPLLMLLLVRDAIQYRISEHCSLFHRLNIMHTYDLTALRYTN